jgi:hypothetical protein
MREGKMSNYEAKVIKYCRERILPGDYKIEKEVYKGFGPILPHSSIPYQLCTNYLLEEWRENLNQEHLLYLLKRGQDCMR